jgi:hypothetical protein
VAQAGKEDSRFREHAANLHSSKRPLASGFWRFGDRLLTGSFDAFNDRDALRLRRRYSAGPVCNDAKPLSAPHTVDSKKAKPSLKPHTRPSSKTGGRGTEWQPRMRSEPGIFAKLRSFAYNPPFQSIRRAE